MRLSLILLNSGKAQASPSLYVPPPMYIYDKRQRVIEKTNKQTKIIIMGIGGNTRERKTRIGHQPGTESMNRKKKKIRLLFCFILFICI